MRIIILISFFTFLISCSDEMLKRDFHGKWNSVSDESELFVSDEMIVSFTDTDEKRIILGKSNIEFGEISIKNEDEYCHQIPGVYFYEIYKDTLQFRVKEDMCNLRKEILDRKKFIKN